MSDYWKSTPKYWCKHCKAYVRDTKLERQNHDATPKHQGNLKRFLRDLHRGNEKEQKDKERAKQEVARLNGLVSGAGIGEGSSSSGSGRGSIPPAPKQLQATPSQRRQQLAQLAELGVDVPDEFRGELAMAGEWQVTSERIIDPATEGEKKPEAIGIGVRKRAVQDDEEEAEAAEAKKRRWGSTYRTQPDDDDADLDALLSKAVANGRVNTKELNVKQEFQEDASNIMKPVSKAESTGEGGLQRSSIKMEPSDSDLKLPELKADESDHIDVKHEADFVPENVVFKKRKAKFIRQK